MDEREEWWEANEGKMHHEKEAYFIGWDAGRKPLLAEIERLSRWDDIEYQAPHAKEIQAVHPMITGDHATRQRANELVSDRHSKGALVDMVNWLLVTESQLRADLQVAVAALTEISKQPPLVTEMTAPKMVGFAEGNFIYDDGETTGHKFHASKHIASAALQRLQHGEG